MARRFRLQRFRVHAWLVINVTETVEAEDSAAAVEEALQLRDWYDVFTDVRGLNTAYAEDSVGACVDVVGDCDYKLTRYFESRTNPLYEPVRQLLASLDDKAAFQTQVTRLRELLRNFV